MSEESRNIVSISKVLGTINILPSELIDISQVVLSKIGIDYDDYNIEVSDRGILLNFRIVILVQEQLELEFPLLGNSYIVLGLPGSLYYFDLKLQSNPKLKIEIEKLAFGLKFSKKLIQAYKLDTSSDPKSTWIIDKEQDGYSLAITSGVTADIQGNLDIHAPEITGVRPFMIGKTGFIVDFSGKQIANYINKTAKPTGKLFHLVFDTIPDEIIEDVPTGFKGLWIKHAFVYYHKPDSGTVIPPIGIQNAAIGEGGFSGDLIIGNPSKEITLEAEQLDNWFNGAGKNSFELSNEFAAKMSLFGVDAILWSLRLSFYQSIPNAFSLSGVMRTGLSDQWIVFKAAIAGPEGDLFLEVGGLPDEPLLNLETDWYKIVIDSIAYKTENEIHYAIINGGIQVKINLLDLPILKVDRLSVGSDGSIDIEGGWAEFPETVSVDFHGFTLELKELGMGNEGENDERQWFGFSGGINLVQGLKGGASVEGLKVSWDKESGKDLQVTLKGIGVDLEIPDTLTIKGKINYDEETNLFRGSVKIDFISLQFVIEGELIVGKTTDAQGREFDVFYIALSAKLTPGIALGTTGLSLSGIAGLYGMNVAPTRTEEQSWYDWYKSKPAYNLVSVDKWAPAYNNYAFGAGITIGTTYDGGYSLQADIMLAILIPGPVVILEGKADLLKKLDMDALEVPENNMAQQVTKNNGKKEEAKEVTEKQGSNFYMLAVFDGRAGTFQLNIDIKIVIQELVNIGGGLEAFFDFNDDSKWYINVGVKDPESKRIQAEVLGIFTASTYFMISASHFKFGAAVAWGFKAEYGPVAVALQTAFSFDVALVFNPFQAEGEINFLAELGLRVFCFDFGLLLQAKLLATFPKPFQIYGLLHVKFGLPWPLPSFEFDIELEWKEEELPLPPPNLLKGVSFIHHKSPSFSLPLKIDRTKKEPSNWDEVPYVPLDGRPVLHFAKPIGNDHNLRIIFKEPRELIDGQEGYKFRYEIVNEEHEKVTLERYDEKANIWESEIFGFGKNEESKTMEDGGSKTTEKSPLKFELKKSSYLNGIDAEEPQIQLWQYRPLDTYGKYGIQNNPAKQRPCDFIPSWTVNSVFFDDKIVGEKLQATFEHKNVIFSNSTGFDIVSLAKTILHSDRALNFNVRKISAARTVEYDSFFIGLPKVCQQAWLLFGSPVKTKANHTSTSSQFRSEDTLNDENVNPHYNEKRTKDDFKKSLIISRVGKLLMIDKDYELNLSDNGIFIKSIGVGFDTITISFEILYGDRQLEEFGNYIQNFDITFSGLVYFIRKFEIATDSENEYGVLQKNWSKESTDLFLRPNTKYRLNVPVSTTTIVNSESKKSEKENNFIFFKTDYGPGIPIDSNKELEYSKESVHQFENYISKTSPQHGAKNHYYNYDLLVLYNEKYVEAMLGARLKLKVLDQNYKPIIEDTEGSWLELDDFVPFLSANTIAQEISNIQPNLIEKNSEFSEVPPDFFEVPPPETYDTAKLCDSDIPVQSKPISTHPLTNLRPNRKYFCHLIVDVKPSKEAIKLHEFEFVTSYYNSFTEHVAGDYQTFNEKGEVNYTYLKKMILSQTGDSDFNSTSYLESFKDYIKSCALFNPINKSVATVGVELETIKNKNNQYHKKSVSAFKDLYELVKTRFSELKILKELPSSFEVVGLEKKVVDTRKTLTGEELQNYALLFESPEPIEWERLSVKVTGQALEIKKVKTSIKKKEIGALIGEIDSQKVSYSFLEKELTKSRRPELFTVEKKQDPQILTADILNAKLLERPDDINQILSQTEHSHKIKDLLENLEYTRIVKKEIKFELNFIWNDDKTSAFGIFKEGAFFKGDRGILMTKGNYKVHFNYNGERNPDLSKLVKTIDGKSEIINEDVYFKLEL